jgi:hypothetical protein
VRDDVLCVDVFQIDHCGIHGDFFFIHDRSAHGPQLGLFLFGLSLSENDRRSEGGKRDQTKPSARVHGYPPETGCV